MPDFGTGRCDFPNGSATQLFDSIHRKIYVYRMRPVFVDTINSQWTGAKYETKVGESKRLNKQV